MNNDWLWPQLPVPGVKACVTTASHGDSSGAYASFNLALHVGDDGAQVAANRQLLQQQLGCTPYWLQQVHGTAVIELPPTKDSTADASISRQRRVACAILTADCLPVLFCSTDGSCVGAAHAGWRSLAAGVLENTVAAMAVPAGQIIAWLGPAIGQCCFEVGPEVRAEFVRQHPGAQAAFIASPRRGHWQADLYHLARIRLAAVGVNCVLGGGLCSKCEHRFYSFRRQANTGRFASLIWRE